MARFRVSIEAQADLRKISRYTGHNWGLEQRNIYLDKLKLACLRISDYHSIGQPCDHIREGYRYFPVGSHLVFYRVATDDVIEIIRILHKSNLVGSVFPPQHES